MTACSSCQRRGAGGTAAAAEATGVVPGNVAAVAIVMGAVAVGPPLLDWVVDVELVVDPDVTVSVTGTAIFPPFLTETVTVPVLTASPRQPRGVHTH